MKVILKESQLKHIIKEAVDPNMVINNESIGLQILNTLRQNFGFSIEQLVGIGAALYQECRFNPNSFNPTSTAYGIGQWTSDYAVMNKQTNQYEFRPNRLRFMCNYLNSKHGTAYKPRTKGDGGMATPIPLAHQLEWMVAELNGISSNGYQNTVPQSVDNWSVNFNSKVVARILKATTAEQACDIWTQAYEGVAPDNQHRGRIKLIRQMEKYFKPQKPQTNPK